MCKHLSMLTQIQNNLGATGVTAFGWSSNAKGSEDFARANARRFLLCWGFIS
jgi:hypothetical protein